MRSSNINESSSLNTSSSRRKLVGGLVGATAFTALAPQLWTKPVMNRIIAPAHGQAISIAAGTYEGKLSLAVEFESDCITTFDIRFQWGGGLENQVDVDVLSVDGSDGCPTDVLDDIEEFFDDIKEFPPVLPDVKIVVAPIDDQPSDTTPVDNTNPPLPSGFGFFLSNDDL